MGKRMAFDYVYLAGTLAFTIYGQLILKWQVNRAGSLPEGIAPKVVFLLRLMIQPWMLTTFAAAFLAAMCWTAAMTRFEISTAYPFVSLAFVAVVLAGGLLFGERLGWAKMVGVLFIVLGLYFIGRGD